MLLAAPLALALAVTLAVTTASPSAAKAAAYRNHVILKRHSTCTRPPEDCPYIKLQYSEFTTTPSRSVTDALNGAVLRFLLQPILEDGKFKTVEAMVEDFLTRAAAAKRAHPDWPAYVAEKVVTVRYNSAGVVSLDSSFYWFTGGVHPDHVTELASYALATGRKLKLSDLLVPGYSARLNAVAEKRFRKIKEIPPGASLEQAGWTFPGGQFQVNENFMIRSDGLVFYFNTYTITAYVSGATELVVPYAEIRSLIKPGSLFAAVVPHGR